MENRQSWMPKQRFWTEGERDRLVSEHAAMLEALRHAAKLIKVARQYFPKSMRNGDKFDLENTCAAVQEAIAKAEGKI